MRRQDIKNRGLSLLEVIIASAMMLMLLLAFYAIAEMLSRSQITSDARLTARKNLRNCMRFFGVSTSEAHAFYSGDGNPITIGGYSCLLPEDLNGGNFKAGDTLAVAVPQDLTRPVNAQFDPTLASTNRYPLTSSNAIPDGFHDNYYDIFVLTSRPTTPPDSRNPNSRQLVLMRWDNVIPAAWEAPLTIDLGTPDQVKIYDCFLKPLANDGFRVNYQSKGSKAAAAYIHTEYRHQPTNGPAQAENYEFLFNTRNIF